MAENRLQLSTAGRASSTMRVCGQSLLSLQLHWTGSPMIRALTPFASIVGDALFRLKPLKQDPDQLLLENIALGDSAKGSAALSELYDRYSKLVYGFVLSILKDTDDAEDITQEVFVQVWRKAKSYQPVLGAPKNWIVRIAHNRAVNLVRSKRHRNQELETPIPEETDANPGIAKEHSANTTWESTTQDEERNIVAKALAVLSQDHRELIDLAFFQGYSHSEIATLTNIPLGTVKTRLRSGIQVLRSELMPLKNELQ